MRKLTRLILGAVVALGGVASGLSLAQPLPKAETILDQYVEVTGGKAAYEQHKTEVLSGTIAFPAQGLTGQLTRYSAAPDKEYSMVELGPIGKIETGVANGIAWEKSVILGPRIKSGDEKDQAVRESRFNAPLEWRKIYSKVETAAVETAEGEECYKVVMTPATGKPETRFYSRKSGLLLKTTATAASPMGEINVEVTVSDYKNFGGVLMPTRSKQKAGGQELEVSVTSVGVNEAIPPDTFNPPGDVKALIDKAKGN
jgi:zinc protease